MMEDAEMTATTCQGSIIHRLLKMNCIKNVAINYDGFVLNGTLQCIDMALNKKCTFKVYYCKLKIKLLFNYMQGKHFAALVV